MRLVRSLSFASLTLLTTHGAHATTGDDAELARTARLETIVRVALERNRDVAENMSRARAADARSQAASRLPDLEAKYEQWGVPLARPFALDRADTLMFGLRQSFPAWGSLEARGRALLSRRNSRGEQHGARQHPATLTPLSCWRCWPLDRRYNQPTAKLLARERFGNPRLPCTAREEPWRTWVPLHGLRTQSAQAEPETAEAQRWAGSSLDYNVFRYN